MPTRTRTVVPPPDEGRRKHHFTSSEIDHVWAKNTQRSGQAGRVFFSDGIIYFYGHHFPMAAHVRLPDGTAAVFFTTRDYSSSTSHHKSGVLRAVSHLKVYHVHDVLARSAKDHRKNLAVIEGEAVGAYRRSLRARTQKAWLLRQTRGHIARGNEYAAAVGLKDRIGPPDGSGGLDAWLGQVVKEEEEKAEAAAAKMREKLVARQAVREAEYRVEREAKYQKWLAELADWKEGGSHPGPDPKGWGYDHRDFLRIKGRVLETSQHVAVPLRLALPALAAVRFPDYHLPAGFEIDGFTPVVADRDRQVVKVGCHCVDFAEIDRLATRHGLTIERTDDVFSVRQDDKVLWASAAREGVRIAEFTAPEPESVPG